MSSARREDLPRFIPPMLATSGPAPTGEAWAMEIKWDGARMQLASNGRSMCVRSRPGRDCTDEFPELHTLGDRLGTRRFVLDGELVCLGADGRPNFPVLRARLGRQPRRSRTAQQRLATFLVFDLLHLDGRAVRDLPYWRRRELLAELELDGPAWRTPRHYVGKGEGLLAATAEQGLEGVVAKRLDARYVEGRRSPSWVKQKHRRRERFLVTGWRERDGTLPEFFLARRMPDGQLRPAGSASLGLDADRRALLIAALTEHELQRRGRRRSVRWTAPAIEVFADFHGPADGAVRDAVLREIAVPARESLMTRA